MQFIHWPQSVVGWLLVVSKVVIVFRVSECIKLSVCTRVWCYV